MTALAWPVVALLLGAAALWRLDVFVRRWRVGRKLAKRVSDLHQDLAYFNAELAKRASLDEVVALRDKLTQLTNRLGPPR